jgi:NAD(P) transhydrogenase subunit alpha
MRPGSVIVDLAVERGGNVAGAVPGEVVVTDNGVKIVGHLNMPGRVAASASLLYAKNLVAFLETMVDKAAKQIAINRDDDLVKATMLTDAGRVVHPNFASAAADAERTAPAALAVSRDISADPAVQEAAAGTEPGLDVAPKKTARKKASTAKTAGDA